MKGECEGRGFRVWLRERERQRNAVTEAVSCNVKGEVGEIVREGEVRELEKRNSLFGAGFFFFFFSLLSMTWSNCWIFCTIQTTEADPHLSSHIAGGTIRT